MIRAVASCAAVLLLCGPAGADTISSARYSEPTDRYAHGVLGDAIEYGALELTVDTSRSDSLSNTAGGETSTLRIRLPRDRVFEDIAPRVVDVDGDGTTEVIVVEAQAQRGAQLAIYDARGRKIAQTPHIGTRNRWLAPLGAADLDGDGYIEVAYVDRPHLAKTLRVWRFKDRALTEIASVSGFSNHKIGWDYIPGGIRTCNGSPEMILATGNWSRIIAATLNNDMIETRDLGPYAGPDSLNTALTCN